MAKKNFLVVGGEVIGEIVSGVRTIYIKDALMSLVAIADDSGHIVNRYRYTPFGVLAARTGVASDPDFGWREFFRASSRTLTGKPTRVASQYLPSAAQYVSGIPTGARTFSGPLLSQEECSIDCRQGKLPGNKGVATSKCGGWQLQCQFRVTKCKNFDGFVAQEIKLLFCYRDCDGKPVEPHQACRANYWHFFGCYGLRFYEAWRVVIENGILDVDRSDFPVGALDFNSVPDAGDCTRGVSVLSATAGIMTEEEYDKSSFKKRGLPDCAGRLRATPERPPNWPPKQTVFRKVRAVHSCCCDGKHMLGCKAGKYQETSVSFPANPCKKWD